MESELLKALPQLTVKTLPATAEGGAERFEVTWGTPPRKAEVVDLDLGAQFDLAEVTGGNAGNLQWMNMAYIAASVRSVDNVPQPASGWTKGGLRETLRRLGVDGLRAVGLVVNGYRGDLPAAAQSEDQHRATVGN